VQNVNTFFAKTDISAAIFCKPALTKPLPYPCAAADFGKLQQMQKESARKRRTLLSKRQGLRQPDRKIIAFYYAVTQLRAPYQIEE
jgi:hypothetical protein